MFLNKDGAQKESIEKLAKELSAFSHEDVLVEVTSDNTKGVGNSMNSGRDRRDTGH